MTTPSGDGSGLSGEGSSATRDQEPPRPSEEPREGREHGEERQRQRRRRRRAGAPPGEPALAEAFLAALGRLAEHLSELRFDALRLVKARRDRLQVRARAVVFQVAIVAVLAVFGVVALAAAAWLAMQGLSGALNALLGTPSWVGGLVVGLGLPLLAVASIAFVRWRAERKQLKGLMEEYRELERRRTRSDVPPAQEEPVP